MNKQTYGAKDLAALLGVSESMAYRYIQQMNAELAQKGFITCRGKIPKAYVETRFYGVSAAPQEALQDGKP